MIKCIKGCRRKVHDTNEYIILCNTVCVFVFVCVHTYAYAYTDGQLKMHTASGHSHKLCLHAFKSLLH